MKLATIENALRTRRGLLALWIVGTGGCALITVLMHTAGVPGWDSAAHAYKIFLIRDGQSIFWDNHWYGGGYGAITYGFLYYWLATVVPADVIVVLSAGAVPVFYYLYQRDMWKLDDVWPAWLLAGVMSVYLAHGQDPFLFALALSLGGLALLARGRPVLAAVPIGVGIFANPMGLVVTGVLMLADVAARSELRRRYLVFFTALVPFLIVRVVLGLAFSEPGTYLNETSQLLIYLSYSLAGVALAGVNAVHPRRPFVVLFLIYALICVLSFVTPGSPLGNNIGRFFMVFGLPLLFLLRHSRLRRPFPYGDLALIPILLFTVMQFVTPTSHLLSKDERAQTHRDFFAPALAAAAATRDLDHRIHVVTLRRHWEAYYFPKAGLPITRGWYRQADAIHNRLFYGPYDARSYVRWLRRMGVEYVYLPDAALDPWSEREPRILSTSPSFEVARQAGAWTVYKLRDPQPLVVGLDDGEAHVTGFDHLGVTVVVDRPGDYLTKVTWSPYWKLAAGTGQLSRSPDRFILLEAKQAGTYRLRFDLGLRDALAQAVGRLGL
jgi:hypothetical protein